MKIKPKYKNERYQLYLGKSEKVLKGMPSNSVHSIVCDPPYELGFMGKKWDSTGIANSIELWTEALRVLKPGGYLLAFSGSRTYHRMTCAIEDAGFEIRDQVMWLYGSGFPKSQNVGKALDKAAGAERKIVGRKGGRYATPKQDFRGGKHHSGANTQKTAIFDAITAPATEAAKEWNGWGTALKPAHEPICVARKPFKGTVANNVLAHRTGAINIDASRVATDAKDSIHAKNPNTKGGFGHAGASIYGNSAGAAAYDPTARRWPANVIHDGSSEVVAAFAIHGERGGQDKRKGLTKGVRPGGFGNVGNAKGTNLPNSVLYGDSGTAARFFYCAKASNKDRNEGFEDTGPQFKHGTTLRKIENTSTKGNTHPTVKPTDLMRYLVRLVTPPNGIVLDIFMGSGSTGKAAMLEDFKFAGIDMTPEYVEISRTRIRAARAEAKAVSIKKKTVKLFK